MLKKRFLVIPLCALLIAGCSSGCKNKEQVPENKEENTPEPAPATHPEQEVIPEHAHVWCDPEWSWSEDNKTAVATFKCSVYEHYHKIEAKLDDEEININRVKDPDHYEDGVDEYVAFVTFNNSLYYSPSHYVVLPKGEHEFNEFGVCEKDGEYKYPENKIQADGDWYYDHKEYKCDVEIGEQLKEVGDVVYYAYKMEYSGHKIRFENLVGLEEDEFSFGILRYEDVFWETYTYEFDSVKCGFGECLFIKIEAKTAKTNPSFTIYEDHVINEAGMCPHCYRHFGGYLVHNQMGITFDFEAGETYYFRWQAWPGERFYVFYQNSLAGHESEFKYYSLDRNCNPVPYNPAEPFPDDPWEDDEEGHLLYVYGVFKPQTSGNNGYIAVDLEPEE